MSVAIRVGYVDRSSERAAVIEVENVLVAHGHAVLRQRGSREAILELLANDRIDLLVSAWLPGSDGDLVRRIAPDVVRLSVLYEPRCIWGVPDYMPEKTIGSISDLAKPEVLARVERDIRAIADPHLAVRSRNVIGQYGLTCAGYTFREMATDDRVGRFVEDVAEEKWFVIPIWQPHWLHHRYAIRELYDPLEALGPTEGAALLSSQKALERICGPAVAALLDLHLDNGRLNELDDYLQPWE